MLYKVGGAACTPLFILPETVMCFLLVVGRARMYQKRSLYWKHSSRNTCLFAWHAFYLVWESSFVNYLVFLNCFVALLAKQGFALESQLPQCMPVRVARVLHGLGCLGGGGAAFSK